MLKIKPNAVKAKSVLTGELTDIPAIKGADGQTQDLSEYVKNTDYATYNEAGVFKMSDGAGIRLQSDGRIIGVPYDLTTYNSRSVYALMTKGTLENLIGTRIPDVAPGTSETVTFLEEGDIPEIINRIPIAQSGTLGLSAPRSNAYGIAITSTGLMYVYASDNSLINSRGSAYRPITPSNLNYAVTAALTDANKMVLTDVQKESALDTLGAASKADLEDLQLYKFPNATIIGNPTIQNGQVSGFSTTDYLQFPFVMDLKGKAFEINFCFTTAGDISTQQNIIDSDFGIALAILNGKGVMSMSSNGTSWDIGSTTGFSDIKPNTTYLAKLTWDGSLYRTALSRNNGEIWLYDMEIESTKAPAPKTIYIGGGNLFGGHPFKGVIDLNKATLLVNGTEIWTGMDDVGLATRANVSLSNLDEDGEAKIVSAIKNNLPFESMSSTDFESVTKESGKFYFVYSDEV